MFIKSVFIIFSLLQLNSSQITEGFNSVQFVTHIRLKRTYLEKKFSVYNTRKIPTEFTKLPQFPNTGAKVVMNHIQNLSLQVE